MTVRIHLRPLVALLTLLSAGGPLVSPSAMATGMPAVNSARIAPALRVAPRPPAIVVAHRAQLANSVGAALVTLKTYYSPSTGKHWTTTGAVTGDFAYQTTVGYLWASGGTALHAIYGCAISVYNDHFLSPDSGCEGQNYLRVEGYAYDAAPSAPPTAAMYRCYNGGSNGSDDHFDTTTGCGGYATEGLQGYVPLSIVGPTISNTHGGGNKYQKRTYCLTQKPVNCATGEFFHTFTDLAVTGRGLPLRFTRTYNSFLANQSGLLGYGWTDSYSASLTTDASGVITATQGNGSSVTFAPNGAGGYKAAGGVLATLSVNGDGTLTLSGTDRERDTSIRPRRRPQRDCSSPKPIATAIQRR